MDIYCKTCGEPWDMDTLHDEISARIAQGLLAPLPHDGSLSTRITAYQTAYDGYYNAIRDEFYRKGCKAMYAFIGHEPEWCVKKQTNTTAAMSAMIEAMGDDLDGIASMMDDLAFMGRLD